MFCLLGTGKFYRRYYKGGEIQRCVNLTELRGKLSIQSEDTLKCYRWQFSSSVNAPLLVPIMSTKTRYREGRFHV